MIFDAGIVNFKFKEFDAAVEDLSACVKLDKDNTSAYTYLVGLKCYCLNPHWFDIVFWISRMEGLFNSVFHWTNWVNRV